MALDETLYVSTKLTEIEFANWFVQAVGIEAAIEVKPDFKPTPLSRLIFLGSLKVM